MPIRALRLFEAHAMTRDVMGAHVVSERVIDGQVRFLSVQPFAQPLPPEFRKPKLVGGNFIRLEDGSLLYEDDVCVTVYTELCRKLLHRGWFRSPDPTEPTTLVAELY